MPELQLDFHRNIVLSFYFWLKLKVNIHSISKVFTIPSLEAWTDCRYMEKNLKVSSFWQYSGCLVLDKSKDFQQQKYAYHFIFKGVTVEKHCFKLLAVGDRTIWEWIHNLFFQHIPTLFLEDLMYRVP